MKTILIALAMLVVGCGATNSQVVYPIKSSKIIVMTSNGYVAGALNGSMTYLVVECKVALPYTVKYREPHYSSAYSVDLNSSNWWMDDGAEKMSYLLQIESEKDARAVCTHYSRKVKNELESYRDYDGKNLIASTLLQCE